MTTTRVLFFSPLTKAPTDTLSIFKTVGTIFRQYLYSSANVSIHRAAVYLLLNPCRMRGVWVSEVEARVIIGETTRSGTYPAAPSYRIAHSADFCIFAFRYRRRPPIVLANCNSYRPRLRNEASFYKLHASLVKNHD